MAQPPLSEYVFELNLRNSQFTKQVPAVNGLTF